MGYFNGHKFSEIFSGSAPPRKVYSTCKMKPDGSFEHTFNFPHIDIQVEDLARSDLYDCICLTDEADSIFDARTSMNKITIENATNWNYQVKKSDVTWAWTAIQHENIDRRIRRNPDYIIENHRYPPNYNEPLQYVKWKVWNRNQGNTPPKILWLTNPGIFFKLWNSKQKIPHMYIQRDMKRQNVITEQMNREMFRSIVG